jgi:hypothetical protein
MENEIWKPVVGYESVYEVSSCGRVKSLQRMARTWYGYRTVSERILRPTVDIYGYLFIVLCVNMKRKVGKIHILVLTAFKGIKPVGLETRHLDGDKTNNNIENLEWGTKKLNGEDRVRHGTQVRGETNAAAKLTTEQVHQIYLSHLSGRQLSKILGVCRTTIDRVRANKTWTHLENNGHYIPRWPDRRGEKNSNYRGRK